LEHIYELHGKKKINNSRKKQRKSQTKRQGDETKTKRKERERESERESQRERERERERASAEETKKGSLFLRHRLGRSSSSPVNISVVLSSEIVSASFCSSSEEDGSSLSAFFRHFRGFRRSCLGLCYQPRSDRYVPLFWCWFSGPRFRLGSLVFFVFWSFRDVFSTFR
jgi:hypothetical protein